MDKLILKEIHKDFEDLEKVYDLNNRAFPDEERLENYKLLDIVARCKAQAQAIYDNDVFVGFVIGVYSTKYNIYYVWFLAIEENLRSLGYGSKLLQTLGDYYPGAQLVVEIEILDPNSENYDERLRRYDFYHRNGFEKSTWSVAYFGAEFQIVSTEGKFRKEEYEIFWNELWDGKAPKLYPLKEFSK